MRKLAVVPPSIARHKVRDIGSAARRGREPDAKVVDLRAYAGRNILRFPPRDPSPAA